MFIDVYHAQYGQVGHIHVDTMWKWNCAIGLKVVTAIRQHVKTL